VANCEGRQRDISTTDADIYLHNGVSSRLSALLAAAAIAERALVSSRFSFKRCCSTEANYNVLPNLLPLSLQNYFSMSYTVMRLMSDYLYRPLKNAMAFSMHHAVA